MVEHLREMALKAFGLILLYGPNVFMCSFTAYTKVFSSMEK